MTRRYVVKTDCPYDPLGVYHHLLLCIPWPLALFIWFTYGKGLKNYVQSKSFLVSQAPPATVGVLWTGVWEPWYGRLYSTHGSLYGHYECKSDTALFCLFFEGNIRSILILLFSSIALFLTIHNLLSCILWPLAHRLSCQVVNDPI